MNTPALVTVTKPAKGLNPTTNHGALSVTHVFQCELEECTETARHISEIDGARICDICKEIEDDHLS